MDWSNPMAVFGFADEPQTNDGQVDDETDDFYDDEHPREAAAAHPGAPQPSNFGHNLRISQEKKDLNQKKAEMLRAKLLAQRQNTPSKAASRSSTPAQVQSQPVPPQAPAVLPQPLQPQSQTNNTFKEEVKQKPEESNNIGSLEALLDEGKALADAKTAAFAANVSTTTVTTANGPSKSKIDRKQNAETHHKPTNTNARQEPACGTEEHPKHPTNLSDSYYTDLPAWLEVTGFHDVEFRDSKLSTYKERKALEAEAARIAERLEKLKQAEQEAMQSLRMATPRPSVIAMPPPPLPATMPTEMAIPKVNGSNGVKRPRSPTPSPPEKMRCREDSSGFRIRGAIDPPLDARPPPLGRPRTPSPQDLERRIIYPDARRSFSERKSEYQPRGSRVESRDSSLERRQSYYRQDGEPSYYDSYTPREAPRPALTNTRKNSIARGTQYRGSVALDLRKGGVRYFMIKSWKHENVLAAQRENLWATQEKNEELLFDAYHGSRHVVLLFSVNNSKVFQGYALMTSWPDSKPPKPALASNLNSGSAAFSLRWLGTTSTHFTLIGHLKNTLNKDENDEPRVVLVGKDGQEISADAGMGVVWALDEAEAKKKEKDDGR